MARRPVPGSTVTPKDIEFEERCSGLPIDVRTRSGYPPPVPKEKEPAEEKTLYPEGYEAHMQTAKAGKIGTIGDLLRLQQPPYARCVENPALPENAGRHPAPSEDSLMESVKDLQMLRGASGTPRGHCI